MHAQISQPHAKPGSKVARGLRAADVREALAAVRSSGDKGKDKEKDKRHDKASKSKRRHNKRSGRHKSERRHGHKHKSSKKAKHGKHRR